MKKIVYIRVGQVERAGKRGYTWRTAYSQNGTHTWLTRSEASFDARSQGGRASFQEKNQKIPS